MIAISDSSPLILYARIERLELLGELFEEVIVPSAVWNEVVTQGAGRPGTVAIERLPWLRRRAAADRALVRVLSASLGLGEAEAFVLHGEMGGPGRLLLDDRIGRRLARRRGFSVTGSAGLLAMARERGPVTAVGPLLDELRDAGLYLDDAVARELLASAGEDPPHP